MQLCLCSLLHNLSHGLIYRLSYYSSMWSIFKAVVILLILIILKASNSMGQLACLDNCFSSSTHLFLLLLWFLFMAKPNFINTVPFQISLGLLYYYNLLCLITITEISLTVVKVLFLILFMPYKNHQLPSMYLNTSKKTCNKFSRSFLSSELLLPLQFLNSLYLWMAFAKSF